MCALLSTNLMLKIMNAIFYMWCVSLVVNISYLHAHCVNYEDVIHFKSKYMITLLLKGCESCSFCHIIVISPPKQLKL